MTQEESNRFSDAKDRCNEAADAVYEALLAVDKSLEMKNILKYIYKEQLDSLYRVQKEMDGWVDKLDDAISVLNVLRARNVDENFIEEGEQE